MASPLTSTTFANLIKKLLKTLDNYNSTDLTRSTLSIDQNSSGELAGIVLNLALHEIYDLIKDSKYLKALPSTNLSSIADQDYIDLDVEPYLDEIESITEPEQNIRLIKKSWSWYRRTLPDPSEASGEPIYYTRRDNRIYLFPRPTSARTYTVDFVKFPKDLDLDNDVPVLPTHYDYWIIAEAKVKWYEMEDPTAVPPALIAARDTARDTAVGAIMSHFDNEVQSGSHWDNYDEDRTFREFQSPAGQ